MDFVNVEEKTAKSGQKFVLITLRRPQAMNALNGQLLQEFSKALDIVEKAPYRCAIITGEGKAFVAGADISEFQNLNPDQAFALSRHGQELFARLEQLKLPVIAAVNGFALGGGLELVLSCDFALASTNAKWGLPEVTLGLIPGYGGTQRLARKCGEALAKRVALTGELFSAEQGLRCGIFSEVLEPDQLMSKVFSIAENICARGPIAVHMTKACIDSGTELGSEKGYAVEARAFSEVFKTQDKSEGIRAFLEKRTPHFEGK